MKAIIDMLGAQNAGKTTQSKALVSELKEMGYKAYFGFNFAERDDGSISRRAADKGFIINDVSDFASEYDICLAYCLFDHETRKYIEQNNIDFWVRDRSILDHVVYCQYSKHITDEDKKFVTDIAFNHAKRNPVDFGFLCEPIEKIKDDGYRSTNKRLQDDIHAQFIDKVYYKNLGPVVDEYIKNLRFLPYNGDFPEKESISIRNSIILGELRVNGIIS